MMLRLFVLLLSFLLDVVPVIAAMAIPDAEEQMNQLDNFAQRSEQARTHTTRIPLAGQTFADIAVQATSGDPKFQLQLRFTHPQGNIEQVEWHTTRLDQITMLLDQLRSGQIVALVVQTKEATVNGLKPCIQCLLRGWHYKIPTPQK